MRLGAAVIVTSLAFSACSMAGPGGTGAFEIGKELSLQAGETAKAGDSGLRLGFDGVSADSRCPKGEQCVWAGDATARVWLQQGAGARQALELHTGLGAAQAPSVLGYEVRLLRLDPYPITGKPIANADYIATLRLVRGSSAAPER